MSGYGQGPLKYNVSTNFFKLNCEMLAEDLCTVSEEDLVTIESNLKVSSAVLREVMQKLMHVRSNSGEFVKKNSSDGRFRATSVLPRILAATVRP